MKRSLLLVLMAASLFSCRRSMDDVVPETLEGKWVMVAVKDNETGRVHDKPKAINGEVEITMSMVDAENGLINGVTPTNTLHASFTVGNERQISIPCVWVTKVMETSWGFDFLDNVCSSKRYELRSGNRLVLHTEEKTLYFEKN